jgi:tetratricopeptide (TPR) repeat protein
MKKKHGLANIATLLVAGLVVAGGLSGCGTSKVAVQEEETAQTYFERGKQRYLEESGPQARDAARKEFTKAIELDPAFAEAYAYRALVYFSNNVKETIEDCNRAIELDPNLAIAYAIRSRTYILTYRAQIRNMNNDQLTKAIEDYDLALADEIKAIELDPQIQETLKLHSQPRGEASRNIVEMQETKAAMLARIEANRYDPAAFIIVPASFLPADYTKADLLEATAASEKMKLGDNAKKFVSDVVFVRQDGTSVTFRTDDNAISRTMKVDSRTGLTSGQRVRVYYNATRLEIDWRIIAIEQL